MSSGVSVRIEFNSEALARKYRSRAKVAQKVLDESVIADTNPFVRYRTGALARSVQTASRVGQGAIIYDTPYAQKVYYDTKSRVTRDIHRDATPFWIEASKKKNLKTWTAAVEKILKGGNTA